jgi:hypothetical protein
MVVGVTVKEKIAYGFENALNYSRDDFDEDGHATTIRLIASQAYSFLNNHAFFRLFVSPHLGNVA